MLLLISYPSDSPKCVLMDFISLGRLELSPFTNEKIGANTIKDLPSEMQLNYDREEPRSIVS